MDGDLSHPPEKLPELIEQIKSKNADFTIGSRFVKGGSSPYFNFYRKTNALISKLMAMPLTRVKDPMAGFFAFRKNLIKEIDNLNPLGFKIGLEIIVKTTPEKITEIPITFEERFGGESKLNLKEQINFLIHLHRLYQYKYTKFTQMTSFAFIGSLGMVLDLSMVYICYKYLNIPYRFSRVSGFIFALSLNFILNRKITFPDAKHDRIINQYISFFAVCLLGMSVNWSISVFLYDVLPFFNKHYLFAAFIGIMGGFLLNFTGSRLYVFRKKS
jgi:dolichol-phosphate mannosyltransferase